MASLVDRLEAAFDAVASLRFDALSGAEVLEVADRLQRLRCRQPTVEHRLIDKAMRLSCLEETRRRPSSTMVEAYQDIYRRLLSDLH